MTLNEGYRFRHTVRATPFQQPLASYLAFHFPHSSELHWENRILDRQILLDNQVAIGDEALRPGMNLVWNRPAWTEQSTPQSYSVVFRDEHLLAVDKPSGLPTLPGAGFHRNTLLNLVRTEYPVAIPVHRLGRATSGILLFALNQHSASVISKAWPTIQKYYDALGSGLAEESVLDIQAPIGEVPHERLGKIFAATSDGKASRSVATVLQRRTDSTVFEVRIYSGRPHQIRIHLAFAGHPLVGDPLYEVGGNPKRDNPGLPGDPGYFLHAKRLVLEHPVTKENLQLIAPTPEILRVE